MSFNYKNPVTPLFSLGNVSVPRTEIFGTNFSVLSTGGYMEVYNLSDLQFIIPSGTTGLVEFSSNTIPVQVNVGSGTIYSPNVLTLNSDNISSGRRRIGMLVYVINENQVYQYQIPNFTTLWNSVTGSTGPGGPTVVFSQFGTTVKNNTAAGQNFISSWTGSTIEGYSGGTRSNSNWIKYYGTDLAVTGGSFSNITNVLTLTNITGGTIPITGFTSFDRAISAFTYDNANTFIIDDNSGNTYTATIDIVTGLTVNGDLSVTGNTNVSGLSATTISATTYQNLPVTFDRFVTGFTYSPNTFTIFDNSGSTFDATINTMSGLTVNGDLSVTGDTNVNGLTATTISATTYQNLPISSSRFVTGFTYSPNTFTITDNSGSTFDTTINSMTGLTVNGNLSVTGDTTVNGLTATTISATTYQNLPITFDRFVTGFTYSPNTFTIFDNSGSTFDATIDIVSGLTVNGNLSVTGDTNVSGLSATTISATTYQNLPVTADTFVTGFTYSSNTLTILRNQSQPNLTVTINTMTGLTVNGNLSVTGDTNVSGLSATTISATTYQNLPVTFDRFVTGFTYSPNTFTITDNSGSTFNAVINTVSGLTVNGNLSVTGDTNVSGLSATTISATTYQNLPVTFDRFVTGFTYSPNTFTIFDNSGSTFNATIDIVSGLTVNGNLSVTGNTNVSGLSATTISATTYQNLPVTFDRFVTGFTYSPNTFTISDNSGSTFNATINTMSGLTVNGNLSVTGNTNVSGLSATTISATTYQNLPADFNTFVTGFTYSPNTFTISDNSGSTFNATINTMSGLTINGDLSVSGDTNLDGPVTINITSSTIPSGTSTSILSITGSSIDIDFDLLEIDGDLQVSGNTILSGVTASTLNVTGNTIVNGLTATTISATTYQNLPIDPDTYVTGFTYTPNTFTISDNSGSTFNATIDIVSGLTVNGDLSVTGDTTVNGLTATTISATTYQNLPVTTDTFVTGFTYSPNTFTISDNSGSTFDATIDIVSGLTVNGDLSVTGDTNVSGLSATTISATTYQNLPIDPDTYVTGFTYSPNTFTISDNSGSTFDATIDIVSGLTVNGNLSVTGDTNVNGLTATTISATTYQNLPVTFDRFVTGFTYSPNTFTIFDNSGSTFNATIDIVSGLTVNGDLSVTGTTSSSLFSGITFSGGTYYGDGSNLSGITDYFTTGATFDPITKIGTFTRNDGNTYTLNLSSLTTVDNYVTGFTYTPNTFTITDNSGSTFNATIDIVTGLTVNGNLLVTGNTNVSGLSATTISATTYQNLPVTFDRFVTGFTYTPNTFTISDNSGSTFNATINTMSGLTVNGNLNVTGDTNVNGLSATTISATTYQNLPVTFDRFVTGFTYSPNTFTITDNSGFTFDATIDIVSGLTVNGNLSVTGDTNVSGLSATTISATTYQNLPISSSKFVTGFTYSPNTFTISDNSGSTFNATINTMSGLTINGNLTVTGNTNVNGLTATTISATTYQNLPISSSKFVTGFTYSPNTFTITDNSGSTFNATINTMSGLTVNGNLLVTGNTNVNGLTATTISATTYQNLPVTADTFVTGFTYLNNTFSLLRNQGQPNLTATINTMTGLTVNGNLTVTGNTSVQGITGTSAVFSANSQNIVTIFGSGSTQPIFVIQGSSGQLFSVTDSLVGSLFSVNDISGLPILEVFSDNTILMGSYLSPSLNTTTKISLSAGTNNIYSIPTSAYTGAFIEYTLSDTSNARSGTMMSVFSGSSVQFNETTTLDIGNTSSVTMSFVISGGNCILRATSISSGYSIKVIIRTI